MTCKLKFASFVTNDAHVQKTKKLKWKSWFFGILSIVTNICVYVFESGQSISIAVRV